MLGDLESYGNRWVDCGFSTVLRPRKRNHVVADVLRGVANRVRFSPCGHLYRLRRCASLLERVGQV